MSQPPVTGEPGPAPLRTPLFDWHATHGGRMVDFAGWEMPIQYASIIEEHHAVRRAAGVFDVSHMGRLLFRGAGVAELLNRVLTNDAARLKVGQIRYSLVCQDDGGILDDVLVYRLADGFLLVVNASNRVKIVDWINQREPGLASLMHDLTLSHGMFAVQGPASAQALTDELRTVFESLKYYTLAETLPLDANGGWLISRTGYTGEDGYEIICPTTELVPLWEQVLERGAPAGLIAAGLGARDTLRLEAAMPLYGHELSEQITPWEAGLEFAVKMEKTDFIGRAALADRKGQGVAKTRVGLRLAGRRIAREHSHVFAGEELIGMVSSGTFSPTLEQSIAMGYIDQAHAQPGTSLQVDLRGKREPAEVVPLPFYQRAR